MDCFNCTHKDCICDSDILTSEERSASRKRDTYSLIERGITYDSTTHKRQVKTVDPVLYRKAQNRHFHRKYYLADPEKHRAKGRESYYRNKEARLEYMKRYNEEHKEEISANKKTYYQEHREEILAKRKEAYQPKGKKPVIDTHEAELKRQRSNRWYEQNKEEINRRRRERRAQQNENNKRKSTEVA